MENSRLRAAVFLCLLVALVGASIAGCGGGGSSSSSTAETTTEAEAPPAEPEGEPETEESGGLALAPAFTSDELNEEAGDNWITNGGTSPTTATRPWTKSTPKTSKNSKATG